MDGAIAKAQQLRSTSHQVFDENKPVKMPKPSEGTKTRQNIFSKVFSRAPVEIKDAFEFTDRDSQSIKFLKYIAQKLYLFKVVSKGELYGIEKYGLDASSPEKALSGQYSSATNGLVTLVVVLPAGFKKNKITVKRTDQVWVEGRIPSKYLYVVNNADKENKKSVKVQIDGEEVNLIPVADYIGKVGIAQRFARTDAAAKYKQDSAIATTKLDLIAKLEKCKKAIIDFKTNPKKKGELMALFRSTLNAIEGHQGAVRNKTTFEEKKEAAEKEEAERKKRCSMEATLAALGTQPGGIPDAPDAVTPEAKSAPVQPAISVPAPPATVATPAAPVAPLLLPSSVPQVVPATDGATDPKDIELKIEGGKPRRKKANAASAATAPRPRQPRKPRRPS